MTKDEVQELRMIRNEPCVSIIVPIQAEQKKEKGHDTAVVNNAINSAMRQLTGKYGEKKIEYLLNKLKRLSNGLQNIKDAVGLGIFLSKDVSKVVSFPFEVQEKVFVGEEFETRDLVYTTKCLFEYYFLMLSKKTTKLFRGFGDMVTEVVDENFPRTFQEDADYEESYFASPISSLPKTEGAKTIVDERRLRDIFKNIDYLLFLYLKKNTPLIVGGVNESLGIYKHITVYGRNIIGFTEGNFDHCGPNEIRQVLKSELRKYTEKENAKLVKGFQEMLGTGKVVWGISECWKAVIEGRVMALLVEKDYVCHASVSANGKTLNLNGHQKQDEQRIMNDAVNNMISMALDKGGDVIFLENGKLASFERIAVVLKFSS